MKTSEMIAMLEKNPDLQFKRKFNGEIYCLGAGGCVSKIRGSYAAANMRIDDDWQLVREPVPVWEAVKAFCEGKDIICEIEEGGKFTLRANAKYTQSFTKEFILNGTWYIEGAGK